MNKLTRRDVLALGSTAVAAATLPLISMPAVRANTPVALRWMGWGGATAMTKISQAIATGIPALGARYTVQAVDGGPTDQDVAATLRLALASGQNLPDIAMLNKTQVAEFAAAGELLPLDDIYSGGVSDDVYSGGMVLAKNDGQLVGVPFELKSKLFFYNTDLFDKAGVSLDSLGTFDGFIAAGDALKQKAESTITNLGPQPAPYLIDELMSAYDGVNFFAGKDGHFDIGSSPAFREVFAAVKKLYDAGVTTTVDDWSSDWQPAIAAGKIATLPSGNWMKLFLPSFAPKQAGQWKVGLWPKLSPLADQRYGSSEGGSVFVVLKRAPNAKAAADYLRQVFLQKEGALVTYNAFGTTPLLKSAKDEFLSLNQKPVKPTGMSDSDFALLPANYFGPDLATTELQSYDYIKIVAYDPAASKGFDIMMGWIHSYLTGSADLDTALHSAQADMESQIGNPFN